MAKKRSKRNGKKKAGAPSRKSSMKSKRGTRALVMAGANANARRQYMNLVRDPCYGPLVRSVSSNTGTSLIQRVRTTYTNITTTGYIVWFPTYHGSNAQPTGNYVPYNVFAYEGTPGSRPTNTNLLNLGKGTTTASDQGRFLVDPAAAIISPGSAFDQAKTIAACITTEYIGSMVNAAGLIAKVANITVAGLHPAVNPPRPLSTVEVIQYAAARGRVNIEGEEVRWRPTESSSVLRDRGEEGSGGAIAAGANPPNTMWWMGDSSSSSTALSCVDPENQTGIIMAWSGVPIGALNINLVKVIECELAPYSGSIEEPKAPPVSANGTTIDRIVGVLDEIAPYWQTSVSEMARGALRGVGRAAVNSLTMPMVPPRMASTRYPMLMDGAL